MSAHSIKSELAARDSALFQTVGVSMEPMLHARKSSVRLEKPKGRLRKNDVALFERANGQQILHRVIRVLPDGYLIRGDNCVNAEPVAEAQILGVMTGYFPDESGRFVTAGDPAYTRYVRTLPFRFGLLRLKSPFSAAKRRFLRIARNRRV